MVVTVHNEVHRPLLGPDEPIATEERSPQQELSIFFIFYKT